MKKVLSVILCALFLNMICYPAVIALEDSDTAESPAYQTQDDTQVGNNATDSNYNEDTYLPREEHLQIRKDNSKKIQLETVYIDSHGVEIPASDILQIAFISDFNGKKARVGDEIEFKFPNEITTQEGTVILPSTTRVIAEITKLKKPKLFHLSGKIYLKFKYIQLADGTRKNIDAKLYSKKDYLSRKTLNKTAAVGETVAGYGAGAATGAIIGASSGASVFSIILCGSFGAGIGAIAGVAVGIILPGASFKAKAGQRVTIQLTQELDI